MSEYESSSEEEEAPKKRPGKLTAHQLAEKRERERRWLQEKQEKLARKINERKEFLETNGVLGKYFGAGTTEFLQVVYDDVIGTIAENVDTLFAITSKEQGELIDKELSESSIVPEELNVVRQIYPLVPEAIETNQEFAIVDIFGLIDMFGRRNVNYIETEYQNGKIIIYIDLAASFIRFDEQYSRDFHLYYKALLAEWIKLARVGFPLLAERVGKTLSEHFDALIDDRWLVHIDEVEVDTSHPHDLSYKQAKKSFTEHILYKNKILRDFKPVAKEYHSLLVTIVLDIIDEAAVSPGGRQFLEAKERFEKEKKNR